MFLLIHYANWVFWNSGMSLLCQILICALVALEIPSVLSVSLPFRSKPNTSPEFLQALVFSRASCSLPQCSVSKLGVGVGVHSVQAAAF